MAIPRDKTFEFIRSDPSLNVVRAGLTLRDAVAHFLSLPIDEQRVRGIGVHEAVLVEIGARRPAATLAPSSRP